MVDSPQERSSDYVSKESMSSTIAGGIVIHAMAHKNSLVELPSRMKKIKDSLQSTTFDDPASSTGSLVSEKNYLRDI